MSKRSGFIKSFGYAGNGIKEAFQNEPNFRFHTIAGFIAIIFGIILHLSALKFTILILTISFVIVLELINTCIEKIVDVISPDYTPSAKIIKDMSAASVLLAAFAAIVVGLLLFVPQILPL